MRYLLVFFSLVTINANAALISVSGPLSTLIDDADVSTVGSLATIIGAPALATNNAVTNEAQQGFDEQQGVLLGSDIFTDQGIVTAGTRVDSHMIFVNSAQGFIEHFGVSWVFDGIILGVMSDQDGALESATNSILGAIGTTYEAPFNLRGMEGIDSYNGVGTNSLTVGMRANEPAGDWIRVLTSRNVPEPLSLVLMSFGLIGLGFSRSKKE